MDLGGLELEGPKILIILFVMPKKRSQKPIVINHNIVIFSTLFFYILGHSFHSKNSVEKEVLEEKIKSLYEQRLLFTGLPK